MSVSVQRAKRNLLIFLSDCNPFFFVFILEYSYIVLKVLLSSRSKRPRIAIFRLPGSEDESNSSFESSASFYTDKIS